MSIKENRKGSSRSYQGRRALFLVFVILVVVCLTFLLVGTNNQVSFIAYAAAEHAEVHVDGRIVTDEVGLKSGKLQNLAKNIQQETNKALHTAHDMMEKASSSNVKQDENSLHGLSPVYPLSQFPVLKYGTAWKKEQTAGLVRQALHAGFRHIDTACQPKHYNEKGVGEGWTAAAADLGLQRSDIWIQTKFTNLAGQDPNTVPYDKNADLEEQVRQSLEISLQNLQTDYIDSLVMHGPELSWDGTLKVWAVFETFVDAGKVKQLGISNAWDADFVKFLYGKARIKPSCVQMRFHAPTKFEVEMREFCLQTGMEFQSFWTIGANRHALMLPPVQELAQRKKLSPEVLLYAFCLTVGISPLDGTTSEQHMAEDIDLIKRIRSGENIFENGEELSIVAEALGIPGWTVPEEVPTFARLGI